MAFLGAMKMIAQGKTADEFKGRDQKVIEIYLQRHKANRHKMVPIPVCKVPEEWLIG